LEGWGGGFKGVHNTYYDIISVQNLLVAWQEFLKGKRKRRDVERFSVNLLDNILKLNRELADKTYRHGAYHAFRINDPRPRNIHKASVRDRLLHHAIYRILYPYFDPKFIFDSFSCRRVKGTHRAINRFHKYCRKVSHNHTRTVWVLKCDIKKFFENINHGILMGILKRYIQDDDVVWLLGGVMDSFHSKSKHGTGLPLGNLTSQLLVNIYMNEFDHFVKRELGTLHYIRYADDFIIIHESRRYLENLLPSISIFLEKQLKLQLHPDKVFIKTLYSGVDFLGWVHFSTHRVLRTTTKHRMFRNIQDNRGNDNAIQSYLGLISHGNARGLGRKIEELLL